MSPAPQFVSNAVRRLMFHPAIISRVTDLSGYFRLIEMSGETLKGLTWVAGQIVQFHLGGLTARPYTPMSWDPIKGSTEFLIFVHGRGPGSVWVSSLKRGDECQHSGPQKSSFGEITSPIIFFGDETSFASAQALRNTDAGTPENNYVFEVSSVAESEEVLRSLSIPNVHLVQKLPGDAHLSAIEEALSSRAVNLHTPQWILTGNAQSIQTLRRTLRGQSHPPLNMKVQAHWSEGRPGFD